MCVVAVAAVSRNAIGLAYCNFAATRQCSNAPLAFMPIQFAKFVHFVVAACGGLRPAFIYDNDLCQRFIEFFTPKHIQHLWQRNVV